MNAVVSPGSGKDASVQQKPVPKINANEVLVKTQAAALNPTDWKHMRYISPEGAIMGCDFSGIVKDVGPDVKDIKVGDRVASAVHGSCYPAVGAFAEYLKADAKLLWKVPENTSFEDAAAIGGVGCETAAFALYPTLKKALPGQSSSGEPFLVWSGATSVGMYAIQLAKASGLRVVTTASTDNHDFLKSLGAEECFDYKDENVAEKVKKWAGDKGVTSALDCISEKGSTKGAASCMTGGKVITLLPVDAQKEGITNVEVEGILLYTTFGYSFTFFGKEFPAMPDHYEARSSFLKNQMSDLVAKGRLKANPLKKLEGGLESVLEGMKYMEAGKAKRQKLVYSF